MKLFNLELPVIVIVNNKDDQKFVQDVIFNVGGEWANSNKKYLYFTNVKYIFIRYENNRLFIRYSNYLDHTDNTLPIIHNFRQYLNAIKLRLLNDKNR